MLEPLAARRAPLAGRRAAVAFAALCLLVLAPGARADDLDDGVLIELNFARTHPADYARELRNWAPSDDPGAPTFADDPAALNEAIRFLDRQAPLPPLKRDARLAAAALDHAARQGPTGQIGHSGPGEEGLGQRLHRHGVWTGMSAENISYGYRTPRDVVRQLIIDSGVPSRGHRTNIFGQAFQTAGVACGRHRTYGSMCVIDFAGAIVAR